jgi:hypothetical protein
MVELSEVAELIVKHLPPSAGRVQVQPLDAVARTWAEALTVNHFVDVCDDAGCDAALASDLALISQARLRPGGRVICLLSEETRSLSDLASILSNSGFVRILTEPVLGDVFILARGEWSLATRDPNAEVGVLRGQLSVVPAGQPLPRYLHLLVHQEPSARGWEPATPTSVTWDALTLRDTLDGQSVLLGFSALVKAVAFMKPAVIAGVIPEVNKMPRYRGETVAAWRIPVLVNPAFEAIRGGTRYTFESQLLRIDPKLEDRIRE